MAKKLGREEEEKRKEARKVEPLALLFANNWKGRAENKGQASSWFALLVYPSPRQGYRDGVGQKNHLVTLFQYSFLHRVDELETSRDEYE